MTGKNILTSLFVATIVGAGIVAANSYARNNSSSNSGDVATVVATTTVENNTADHVTKVFDNRNLKQDTSYNLNIKKITTSSANVIMFNVPVVEQSVAAALDLLRNMDGEIYLKLDSPGGSVIDGAKLTEYIKYSGKNIHTVCDGLCASMAFQIFQVGKTRLMTEKSILMAHPASAGTQGTIENMKAIIDMFKLYVDRMDKETADRAKLDYNKFKVMVSDNLWVETPEALKLGLADQAVHLNVTGNIFGKAQDYDVREILRKNGKLTPAVLSAKGYIFNSIKN